MRVATMILPAMLGRNTFRREQVEPGVIKKGLC